MTRPTKKHKPNTLENNSLKLQILETFAQELEKRIKAENAVASQGHIEAVNMDNIIYKDSWLTYQHIAFLLRDILARSNYPEAELERLLDKNFIVGAVSLGEENFESDNNKSIILEILKFITTNKENPEHSKLSFILASTNAASGFNLGGTHWISIGLEIVKGQINISYYDSLGSDGRVELFIQALFATINEYKETVDDLATYLGVRKVEDSGEMSAAYTYIQKGLEALNEIQFIHKESQQQQDGYNCGIFAVFNALNHHFNAANNSTKGVFINDNLLTLNYKFIEDCRKSLATRFDGSAENSLFNFGFTHFVYAEEPNIINVVTFDEPRISDPKNMSSYQGTSSYNTKAGGEEQQPLLTQAISRNENFFNNFLGNFCDLLSQNPNFTNSGDIEILRRSFRTINIKEAIESKVLANKGLIFYQNLLRIVDLIAKDVNPLLKSEIYLLALKEIFINDFSNQINNPDNGQFRGFFRYFLGDGEENNQENLSEEEIAKFSNHNITLPNNSSKRFELIEVLETKLNYLNGQQINETIFELLTSGQGEGEYRQIAVATLNTLKGENKNNQVREQSALTYYSLLNYLFASKETNIGELETLPCVQDIIKDSGYLNLLINEIAKHKVDGKIHEPQEAIRTVDKFAKICKKYNAKLGLQIKENLSEYVKSWLEERLFVNDRFSEIKQRLFSDEFNKVKLYHIMFGGNFAENNSYQVAI